MDNKIKPTPQKASQNSDQNTGVTRGQNPLEIEDDSEVPDSDTVGNSGTSQDSRVSSGAKKSQDSSDRSQNPL